VAVPDPSYSLEEIAGNAQRLHHFGLLSA